MERKIVFSEGEFYHIYNRGVDKRKIFLSVSDYRRFLALLYHANDSAPAHIANTLKRRKFTDIFQEKRETPLVAIGAYCLMPNHFHILMTPLVEGGISRFMLKLQTGYSMYFNLLNDRNGALFQGKFKAEHANSDVYLQYLYAYIHLNPIALQNRSWKSTSELDLERMQSFVTTYPYSSCHSYILRNHSIADPKPFPDYFTNEAEFEDSLKFWIKYRGEENIKGGP